MYLRLVLVLQVYQVTQLILSFPKNKWQKKENNINWSNYCLANYLRGYYWLSWNVHGARPTTITHVKRHKGRSSVKSKFLGYLNQCRQLVCWGILDLETCDSYIAVYLSRALNEFSLAYISHHLKVALTNRTAAKLSKITSLYFLCFKPWQINTRTLQGLIVLSSYHFQSYTLSR